MRYKRDDEIWEIECTECGMRLTEVIVGSMPISSSQATTMARFYGWSIESDRDVCLGCSNVSK